MVRVKIIESYSSTCQDIQDKINSFISLNETVIKVNKIKLKITLHRHCVSRTCILTYKFLDPLVTNIEEPTK